MKKKLTIIFSVLVIALVLATIALAIIPINLYNGIESNISSIVVYKNGVGETYEPLIDDDSQVVIDKIYDLQKKSIGETILSSWLQSTSSFTASINKETTSSFSSLLTNTSNVFVEFKYSGTQTLMLNGEVYLDKSISTPAQVEYTSLFLPISNTSSFDNVTIYVAYYQDGSVVSKFQIKTIAHQSDLYSYIMDLESPVWH